MSALVQLGRNAASVRPRAGGRSSGVGTTRRRLRVSAAIALPLVAWSSVAAAQPAAPAQSGKAPADLSQTVTAPAAAEAPTIAASATDSTNVAVSAGTQYAVGNSRSFAATGLGKIDMRRGNDGFGASLLGNYAEGFVQSLNKWQPTTQNVQGKVRYDRYFTSAFGAFLQLTGTYDPFQGVSFRLNADPGVKLFFYDAGDTKFWGELGYDFELDENDTDSHGILQSGAGGNALDAKNLPFVVEKQNTIHSTRAFLGLKHAFNKEVTLALGLEYLQGVGGTGTGLPDVPPGFTAAGVDRVALSVTGARLNADALLAANVGGGFSFGVGASMRYNSTPLAGKESVDSTGTVSLIYAFSAKPPAAAPQPAPATQPPPASPAPAGPPS